MDWSGFPKSKNVEDRQREFSPLAAAGIGNPIDFYKEIAEIIRRGAWTTPYSKVFPEKYGPIPQLNAGQLSIDAGVPDIGVPFSLAPGMR